MEWFGYEFFFERWILDSDQHGLRGVPWTYVVLVYYKLLYTITMFIMIVIFVFDSELCFDMDIVYVFGWNTGRIKNTIHSFIFY